MPIGPLVRSLVVIDNLADKVRPEQLNGFHWDGITLHCILQITEYPKWKWLVHPWVDPAFAPPLENVYRASFKETSPSCYLQPSVAPSGYYGRHRNPSISSASGSSAGSRTPPTSMSSGGTGISNYHRNLRAWCYARMSSVFIDDMTGYIVSTDVTIGYEPQESRSHYRRVSLFDPLGYYQQAENPDGADDPNNPSQPQGYAVPVEQRTIIIRELHWNVKQAKLEEFIQSSNLSGVCQLEPDEGNPEMRKAQKSHCHALVYFATPFEAIQAVHKLNGKTLENRCLKVELARDSIRIRTQSRARTSSIESSLGAVSLNAPPSPSERRRRTGPIIVDGSQ